MTLGQRIHAARKHADMTQGQVAAAIRHLEGGEKCRQQTVSKLENDQQEDTSYLPHIAYVTGVNAIWLALGLGSMLDGALSAEEREWLELRRRLTDEQARAAKTLFSPLDESAAGRSA